MVPRPWAAARPSGRNLHPGAGLARQRFMTRALTLIAILAAAAGCSDDDAIDSDEAARRAYLGLDGSIGVSLGLGFDGFNAASSANIPPQMATGVASGTLTISGQVDQGASTNKGMRLEVGMVDYSDGVLTVMDGDEMIEVDLTYATSAVIEEQPALDLSLRDIPNGTFTGTLAGTYQISGDISGEVTLALTMSGAIQDDGTGDVIRVPGSTTISGTATSGDGLYTVAITR
jgi:hypothetical protein